MKPDPDILFERRGGAGIVTLNRPRALNAVTQGMVRALAAMLEEWRLDPAVTRIVVTAAGDRAFCAGGDIRALYELGMAGRREEALAFWRDEYRLNTVIKNYPKPYIALIDGMVMGGGVGVSVHGSHRIAGERYRFAMPEVGIGFFPDVGATFILSRLPGEIGTYLALTGERLAATDAVAVGLATHRAASGQFPSLLEALGENAPLDVVLDEFAVAPEEDAPLMGRRATIDRSFADDRVEEIIAALEREAGSASADARWAAATAATMRTKSPTSLKLALAQMRRGRGLAFEDCMRTEFRIVSRIVHGHDFYEGVRAIIIDKDNAPHWRPADLAAVTDAEIERHFAPLGDAELRLP